MQKFHRLWCLRNVISPEQFLYFVQANSGSHCSGAEVVSWQYCWAGAAPSLARHCKGVFWRENYSWLKPRCFLTVREKMCGECKFFEHIYQEVDEWQAHKGRHTHKRWTLFSWLLQDDMQFLQRKLHHPALLETSSSIYSLQSFLFNLNTVSLEWGFFGLYDTGLFCFHLG